MSTGRLGENNFLSPVETRRLLGVSRTRIQQFERGGHLHPVVDERGVHRFDRGEVERLQRLRAAREDKRPQGAKVAGDVAARVFECFDEGWTLPQIVRETKLSPESVRGLYVEYRTPFEHAPLAKTKGKTARNGNGATTKSEDLVAVIAQLDARLRREGT